MYLYKQHSFREIELRPLAHVHTGNIYIDDEGNCRLGGYENKLLGYRTRIYTSAVKQGFYADIDVIMFGVCGLDIMWVWFDGFHWSTGHVMYEMVSGKALPGLFPEEEAYQSEGEGDPYRGCKEMLRFIFTRREKDIRLAHSIKQVSGEGAGVSIMDGFAVTRRSGERHSLLQGDHLQW